MAVLKVSSRSNPNAVAGAFAGVVREEGRAEVHVVGAGALNQAVKAVAIARGFLTDQGLDLVCVPSFTEIDIEGRRRTALRLVVEARPSEVTRDEVAPAKVLTEGGGSPPTTVEPRTRAGGLVDGDSPSMNGQGAATPARQ